MMFDPFTLALIGGGIGALTNKDPLKGAGMGAATGGLGGLSAVGMGAPSLASIGGGSGLLAGQGAAAAGMGGAQGLMAGATGAAPTASGGMAGLLSKDNLNTVTDVAGLAQKAGIFDNPTAPQAPSAGIPGRGGVDFSGLLSAGRANDMTGAQRLAQQRAARMGRG